MVFTLMNQVFLFIFIFVVVVVVVGGGHLFQTCLVSFQRFPDHTAIRANIAFLDQYFQSIRLALTPRMRFIINFMLLHCQVVRNLSESLSSGFDNATQIKFATKTSPDVISSLRSTAGMLYLTIVNTWVCPPYFSLSRIL